MMRLESAKARYVVRILTLRSLVQSTTQPRKNPKQVPDEIKENMSKITNLVLAPPLWSIPRPG